MTIFDQRSFELGSRIGADAYHKRQTQKERILRDALDRAVRTGQNKTAVLKSQELSKLIGSDVSREAHVVGGFDPNKKTKHKRDSGVGKIDSEFAGLSTKDRKAKNLKGKRAKKLLSGDFGKGTLEPTTFDRGSDEETFHADLIVPDKELIGLQYQTDLRKKRLANLKLTPTEEYIANLEGQDAYDYFGSPKFSTEKLTQMRSDLVSQTEKETAGARRFFDTDPNQTKGKIASSSRGIAESNAIDLRNKGIDAGNEVIAEHQQDYENLAKGDWQDQERYIDKYGKIMLDKAEGDQKKQWDVFTKIRTAKNNLRTYYGKDVNMGLTPEYFGLDFSKKKTGKGGGHRYFAEVLVNGKPEQKEIIRRAGHSEQEDVEKAGWVYDPGGVVAPMKYFQKAVQYKKENEKKQQIYKDNLFVEEGNARREIEKWNSGGKPGVWGYVSDAEEESTKAKLEQMNKNYPEYDWKLKDGTLSKTQRRVKIGRNFYDVQRIGDEYTFSPVTGGEFKIKSKRFLNATLSNKANRNIAGTEEN